MQILELIGRCGIIPAVKIDHVKNAMPVAEALQAGGLPLVEVLCRSEAALLAIESIVEECSNVLVGAGTIRTVEQAKNAIDSGAQFIVSAGFNPAVVSYCLDNSVAVIPGVSTPSEIETAAGEFRLNVLKLFPAGQLGGMAYINAIAGPYPEVTFVPTGGITQSNLKEYAVSSRVHAVAGTWIAPEKLIVSQEFGEITVLAEEAVTALLGFQLIHVGINEVDSLVATKAANLLGKMFRFPIKDGSSSLFVGTGFEFMKGPGLGDHGHIAIGTNNIARAVAYFEAHGIGTKPGTAKEKDGRTVVVYLNLEIAGFAFHLIQV